MSEYNIRVAEGDADLASTRRLFAEYEEFLGFSLEFQGFAKELESIGEIYGPPTGRLWLVENKSMVVGCVAVRRIDPQIAELKRLFVTEQARGHGLGKRLMLAALDGAHELGYERIRLDTIPQLVAARGLYEQFGFVKIDPYNDNPRPDVTFMERALP